MKVCMCMLNMSLLVKKKLKKLFACMLFRKRKKKLHLKIFFFLHSIYTLPCCNSHINNETILFTVENKINVSKVNPIFKSIHTKTESKCFLKKKKFFFFQNKVLCAYKRMS